MTNKNLGPKIHELKQKGFKFTQIMKQLKCSSSSVSYHLNPVQKDQARIRQQKQRTKNPLIIKYKKFRQTYIHKSKKRKKYINKEKFFVINFGILIKRSICL